MTKALKAYRTSLISLNEAAFFRCVALAALPVVAFWGVPSEWTRPKRIKHGVDLCLSRANISGRFLPGLEQTDIRRENL
jgi:hypothetical protein